MQNTKNGAQYTFEGFEVTKFNKNAFEKAKQFAEDADAKPLALFGGTAADKTHLLYAVRNAILQNAPALQVVITTTAEMQSALERVLRDGGTAGEFREPYLQADVLLVDDVQNTARKKEVQAELILLFNAFYEAGKRFMMTSTQKNQHWELVSTGKRLYLEVWREHKFHLDRFRTYYKAVWQYFIDYIGLFDINREDLKLISVLLHLDEVMNCMVPAGVERWERQTCILFLDALIHTLSSYDIRAYRGGFYGNGVLYIPLPHHAGTSDSLEITLDEFDRWFDSFCDEYKRRGHL